MDDLKKIFIEELKSILTELDDEIPWILTDEDGDWDKIASFIFNKFRIEKIKG